jgi:hypothetical protein
MTSPNRSTGTSRVEDSLAGSLADLNYRWSAAHSVPLGQGLITSNFTVGSHGGVVDYRFAGEFHGIREAESSVSTTSQPSFR